MKSIGYLAVAFYFYALSAPNSEAATRRQSKASPVSMRQISQLKNVDPIPSSFISSPNGQWLAFTSLPGEKGSDCCIFERRSHRLTTLRGGFRLEPLAFSRDGRRLFVWGLRQYGSIQRLLHEKKDVRFIAVYDLRRRRFTRAFVQAHADDYEYGVVKSGAISPDGRTLTVLEENGCLRAFDVRSGRLKYELPFGDEITSGYNSVLSPDGSCVMVQQNFRGKSKCWRRTDILTSRSGRVLSRQFIHLQPDDDIGSFGGTFSPDGRMAAILSSTGKQWILFDTHSGKRLWKMGRPVSNNGNAPALSFTSDGRRLIVSGANGFEVRNAGDGKLVLRGAELKTESKLLWSSDGRCVYTTRSGDGFESSPVLWQYRLFGARQERHEDELIMQRLHRAKQRFALSRRHINESFVQALRQGDLPRVKFLLTKGAYLETRDHWGGTPLMIAAGNPEMVCFLLSRGAKVNARSKQRDSALTSAALGNFAASKILVEHGADVNASTLEGYSALHGAARFKQLDTVRLLLDHGALVDCRTASDSFPAGRTPLMEAAGSLQPDVETPAEVQRCIEVLKLLVAHGADVNARDAKGTPVLEMAIYPAVIKYLRSAGARPR